MKTMPISSSNDLVDDDNDPMSSPKKVQQLLRAMDKELDRMEEETLIKCWKMAQQRCPPHLIDDQHKLLFLRCEHFHVELACLRLLRYWSMRVQLFGEDKAFQRITLDKTLREDMVAIEMGEIQLTRTYDSAGRGICFDDGSKFPESSHFGNKYLQRRALVRTQWYMLECALEDENVRQNGLTSVVEARKFSIKEFDAEQTRLMCNVLKCVPIRIEEIHICHPPWFIRVLMPLLIRPKYFKNLVLAPTYYHASRSPEGIVKSLEKRGIPRASVPTELGGSAEVKYDEWLRERREFEAKQCKEDERRAAMAVTGVVVAENEEKHQAELDASEEKPKETKRDITTPEDNRDSTKMTTSLDNVVVSETEGGKKLQPNVGENEEKKKQASSSTTETQRNHSLTPSKPSEDGMSKVSEEAVSKPHEEVVIVW